MDPAPTSEEEQGEEVLDLPKDRRLGLSLYQNFWYPTIFLPGVVSFQKDFEAHGHDIVIASQPKSGTTWLKALAFSIINRSSYPKSDSPLLKYNPHELVPTSEMRGYYKRELPCFNNILVGTPRLLSTHIPFASLPKSIKKSNCRIVYICRNPLDTIVSLWHFSLQFKGQDRMRIDELVESFLGGVSYFGPFWEHILGYWRESLTNPTKVLFLKYEDLKENTIFHIKNVAEFLGCPFSCEEESEGVVDHILELCSLDNLRNMEVNKNGKVSDIFDNKTFFRKGVVGDWINHLNSSHVEAIKDLIREKLKGSGLDFKFSSMYSRI